MPLDYIERGFFLLYQILFSKLGSEFQIQLYYI